MEQQAVIGGGCYWCLEAIFQRVEGVLQVESGYSGGHMANPDTADVYTGRTGHAEVVRITFDPSVISYRELLEIFFVMHDPTTLNRQDYDVGDLYRSVIFYDGEGQGRTAREMKDGFARETWGKPVVTLIQPLEVFWPAGPEAKDFYDRNPDAGYCRMIIDPKIQKLRKLFAARLKPAATRQH